MKLRPQYSLILLFALCVNSLYRPASAQVQTPQLLSDLPVLIYSGSQEASINLDDYVRGYNLSYSLLDPDANKEKVQASVEGKFSLVKSVEFDEEYQINKVQPPCLPNDQWSSSGEWIILANNSILLFTVGIHSSSKPIVLHSIQLSDPETRACHDFVIANGGKYVIVDCIEVDMYEAGKNQKDSFIVIDKTKHIILDQSVDSTKHHVAYPFTRRLAYYEPVNGNYNALYRYVVGDSYFEEYTVSKTSVVDIKFILGYNEVLLGLKTLELSGLTFISDDLFVFDQSGAIVRVIDKLTGQTQFSPGQTVIYNSNSAIDQFDASYELSNDYQSSRLLIFLTSGNIISSIDWTIAQSPVLLDDYKIVLNGDDTIQMTSINQVVTTEQFIISVAETNSTYPTEYLAVTRRDRISPDHLVLVLNLTDIGLGGQLMLVQKEQETLTFAAGTGMTTYQLKSTVLRIKGNLEASFSVALSAAATALDTTNNLDFKVPTLGIEESSIGVYNIRTPARIQLGYQEAASVDIRSLFSGPLLTLENTAVEQVTASTYQFFEIYSETEPIDLSQASFVSFNRIPGASNQYILVVQKEKACKSYYCSFDQVNSAKDKPHLKYACNEHQSYSFDTELTSYHPGRSFDILFGKTSSYTLVGDNKYALDDDFSKYSEIYFTSNSFANLLVAVYFEADTGGLDVYDMYLAQDKKSVQAVKHTANLSLLMPGVEDYTTVKVYYEPAVPYTVAIKTPDHTYILDISQYKEDVFQIVNEMSLSAITLGYDFVIQFVANQDAMIVIPDAGIDKDQFKPGDNYLRVYRLEDLYLGGQDTLKTVTLGQLAPDFSIPSGVRYSAQTGQLYLHVRDMINQNSRIIQVDVSQPFTNELRSSVVLDASLTPYLIQAFSITDDTDVAVVWSNEGLTTYQARKDQLLTFTFKTTTLLQKETAPQSVPIQVAEGLSGSAAKSLAAIQQIDLLAPMISIESTHSVDDPFLTKLFSSDLTKFSFTPTYFFHGFVTSMMVLQSTSEDLRYKVYENMYPLRPLATYNQTKVRVTSMTARSTKSIVVLMSDNRVLELSGNNWNISRNSTLVDPALVKQYPDLNPFSSCGQVMTYLNYIIVLCPSRSLNLTRVVVKGTGERSQTHIMDLHVSNPTHAKMVDGYLTLLDKSPFSKAYLLILQFEPACEPACFTQLIRISALSLNLPDLDFSSFEIVNHDADKQQLKFCIIETSQWLHLIVINTGSVTNEIQELKSYDLVVALSSTKLTSATQLTDLKLVSSDSTNEHKFLVICKYFHILYVQISEVTTGEAAPAKLLQMFYRYPDRLNLGMVQYNNNFLLAAVYNTVNRRMEVVAYYVNKSMTATDFESASSIERYTMVGSAATSDAIDEKEGLFVLTSMSTDGLRGAFVGVDNTQGEIREYFLATNITFECGMPVDSPRQIKMLAINDFDMDKSVMTLNDEDIHQYDVILIIVLISLLIIVTLVLMMGFVFEKGSIIAGYLEKVFAKFE